MKNARHPDYAGIEPACAAGSLKYSSDTTANRSANPIFGFTERLKPLAETFANARILGQHDGEPSKHKMLSSSDQDIGQYVEPKRGIAPQDIGMYHRIDLPRVEDRGWVWDLRGREDAYLGRYDFNGKRVLEFGAANGGLTFWMEQQGAEVVALDLSPDIARTSWDVLFGPKDNVTEIKRVMSTRMRGLNNGSWYAHEYLDSKARLVHGTAYDVPTEIGRFDVVTLGAILQHLRDPLGALENAMSFTDQSIIITDTVPVFIRDDLQHLPLAYFAPQERLRTPHGGWTWWDVTAEVYVRFLELKGWRVISKTVGSYEHKSGPRECYTIVAERG